MSDSGAVEGRISHPDSPSARDPLELMAFSRKLAGLPSAADVVRHGAAGAAHLLRQSPVAVAVLALDTDPTRPQLLVSSQTEGAPHERPTAVRTLVLEKSHLLDRALHNPSPLTVNGDDQDLAEFFDPPLVYDPDAFVSVFPIVPRRGPQGVLCIAHLPDGHPRNPHQEPIDEPWTKATAEAVALALDTIPQPLLSQAQLDAVAAAEGDKARVAELSRYLAFFESARDAMLVMNLEGTILFANPVASQLTGRPAGTLVGKSFHELLDPAARALAREVINDFSRGLYPAGVDFQLARHEQDGVALSGRLVSVNFSGVTRETNAVLAAMRDVTEDRALGRELSQTRDFLQRVIESSVDGIVSADTHGDILVYNQAAAKIFGYSKEEVIGRMNVEQLYPQGVARDIMRRIRGREYGGRGRLSEYRVDMRTRKGERIPVTLSASLVMDGQRPVGTVGIFTDVRDKLAMEARLSRAQRELQNHEKQAAIAELAGAAAHELNQPLTAVMGYAEYLKRALGSDPNLAHAVAVIVGETERMANIVKKVGRITRYETKPYVGGAKIVDIEASSIPEEE